MNGGASSAGGNHPTTGGKGPMSANKHPRGYVTPRKTARSTPSNTAQTARRNNQGGTGTLGTSSAARLKSRKYTGRKSKFLVRQGDSDEGGTKRKSKFALTEEDISEEDDTPMYEMRVKGGKTIRTPTQIFGPDITVIPMRDEQTMALWEDFGRTDIDACWRHMGKLHIRYVTSHTSREVKEYTPDAFEKLLGTQMLRFVQGWSSRSQNVITRSMAQRIGLTYSFGDEESYDGPEPETHIWLLKWVWLSDGIYGQKEGRYYASSVGDSTPFMIDLYTFQQWGGLDGSSKIERGETGTANFYQGSSSQVNAVLDIDAWCMKHVGEKLLVNHARSRPTSVYAVQFFDHNKPALYRDDSDQFLRSSFTNALFLIKGRENADKFCHSEPERDFADTERLGYRRSIHNLSHLSRVVADIANVVAMKHVRDSDGVAIDRPSCKFFVDRSQRGVFLAVINSTAGNSHSICIDNREGQGYVYDSSERFAMKLCSESLKLCVGDEAEYSGFTELRQVIINGSGEHKPKKMRRGLSK